VEQVPCRTGRLSALGQPVEKGTSYATCSTPMAGGKINGGAMARSRRQPPNEAVVLFLAASYIDLDSSQSFRPGRDHERQRPFLEHWSQVLYLVTSTPPKHAGGTCGVRRPTSQRRLVRDGRLPLGFIPSAADHGDARSPQERS